MKKIINRFTISLMCIMLTGVGTLSTALNTTAHEHQDKDEESLVEFFKPEIEYSFENYKPFIEYCFSLGYTDDEVASIDYSSMEFFGLYQQALGTGVIKEVENDFLLRDRPQIAPMWQGNGGYEVFSNTMHQNITKFAMEKLSVNFSKAFPNFFLRASNNEFWAVLYSNYPDKEQGFLDELFMHHFYNFDTGLALDNSTDTALSRFSDNYGEARKEYLKSNYTKAFQELGKALHYLQDIGSPPHVGDKNTFDMIGQSLKHGTYEDEALQHQSSILNQIRINSNFSRFSGRPIKSIAMELASKSYYHYKYSYSYDQDYYNDFHCDMSEKGYYPYGIPQNLNLREISIFTMIPYTIEYTAAFLYLFAQSLGMTHICIPETWGTNRTSHFGVCFFCNQYISAVHQYVSTGYEYICNACGKLDDGTGPIIVTKYLMPITKKESY